MLNTLTFFGTRTTMLEGAVHMSCSSYSSFWRSVPEPRRQNYSCAAGPYCGHRLLAGFPM